MSAKSWRVCAMVAVFVLATLNAARAEDAKATDQGKTEDFKGKKFDVKENGKVAFKLEFAADKKVSIIVKGEKQTDINLFVYDANKKEVAKDDSPGPDCLVTFTPKESAKLTIVVLNKGPGDNRVSVKVAFPKD